MITQHVSIKDTKRKPLVIYTYQELSAKDVSDIYNHKFRRGNWQERPLLRYTGRPGGVGQKLNGERVNFQALPTCVELGATICGKK